MDSDSIMKMIEYEFHHPCFIIDAIVSDNNIKLQAVLNN